MKRIESVIGLGVACLCLLSCNNASQTTAEVAEDSIADAAEERVEQNGGEAEEPQFDLAEIDFDDANIFTVVFAISDDGFVNVRETPSAKAAILDTLWMAFHGLGNGVLIEDQDGWSKVSVGEHVGWVNNHYIDYQRWYDGEGDSILVATKDPTPIYGENYVDDDGDYPLFTKVKKGTILADQFIIHNGYYNLLTGHDYLFIKLEDAEIVVR